MSASNNAGLRDSALLELHRAHRASRVTLPLRNDEDVVGLRRQVRERAVAIALSLVDQTKLVTAASELARNTLKYGGGGEVHLDQLSDGGRKGLGLIFVDGGQGIADVEQALRDGFTTGGGLGLGLGGSRRLVDEFEIDSKAGEGTAVSVVKWKR
ncbi:MAG: anti-sigma regulatory factor [Telluria sp.]